MRLCKWEREPQGTGCLSRWAVREGLSGEMTLGQSGAHRHGCVWRGVFWAEGVDSAKALRGEWVW